MNNKEQETIFTQVLHSDLAQGLTFAQAGLLSELRFFAKGDAGGIVSNYHLAKRLHIHQSTIKSIIDKLKEKGYIHFNENIKPRVIIITAKGFGKKLKTKNEKKTKMKAPNTPVPETSAENKAEEPEKDTTPVDTDPKPIKPKKHHLHEAKSDEQKETWKKEDELEMQEYEVKLTAWRVRQPNAN